MEALTESFSFDRVIGVVAVAEDKDVEGVLDELEPVLSEIVVTTNSSPRAMPADELAELARDIFGEDRVHVEQRLDDAIEAAVALADEADAELAGEAGGGGGLRRRRRPGDGLRGDGGRRPAAARAGERGRHELQRGLRGEAACAVGVIEARRPLVKRLLVTVLSMEAVVVLLAIVPAKQLGHVSGGTAAAVCGAIAVVALALCGYVGRGRGAL